MGDAAAAAAAVVDVAAGADEVAVPGTPAPPGATVLVADIPVVSGVNSVLELLDVDVDVDVLVEDVKVEKVVGIEVAG
jgi:hypothetical protein